MNLDEFQNESYKYVAIRDKSLAALAHRTLGLNGEAGAVSNMLKKVVRDKKGVLSEEDRVQLKEKLGDTLFYLSMVAEYADLSLDDIAKSNIEKSIKFKKTRSQ